MARERRAGILRLSLALFSEILKFPEGHSVVFASTDASDFIRGSVSLVVEGPQLPVVHEGAVPEIISYNVDSDSQGQIIAGRFVVYGRA